MKRKLLLSVAALALVGAMAVGGTLAYLSDMTETVTNVFTGGNDDLGGTIVEEFDEESASSYMPGEVIVKEPSFVNNDDSIDAWVAVTVDIDLEGNAISYKEFTEKYADILYNGAEGFNEENWKLINGTFGDVAEDGTTTLTFMYKTVVAAGEQTADLFSTVNVETGIETVFDSATASKTVYKEAAEGTEGAVLLSDGKWYVVVEVTEETVEDTTYYYVTEEGKVETTNLAKLPAFNIVVQGYMVQAQNVDAETAEGLLLDLVAAN